MHCYAISELHVEIAVGHALVQIGVKIQITAGSGQLSLFFGNKADTFLERLLCVVPPAPQFQFQLSSVPSQLEPKKQISVTLSFYPHPMSILLCHTLVLLLLWLRSLSLQGMQ